jgi:hypothetical protein
MWAVLGANGPKLPLVQNASNGGSQSQSGPTVFDANLRQRAFAAQVAN